MTIENLTSETYIPTVLDNIQGWFECLSKDVVNLVQSYVASKRLHIGTTDERIAKE